MEAEGPRAGATAPYTNLDARFVLKDKNYERQYAQFYFYRLLRLRPAVVAAAKQRWPGLPEAHVLDAAEGVECFITGTIYKDMKLKPSILDEYVKDKATARQLGQTRFTSGDDRLILEDESARITLGGAGAPVGSLVTGVVTAVRGRLLASGEFDVIDVCFAGVPPQGDVGNGAVHERALAGTGASGPGAARASDRYVALLSGLGAAATVGMTVPAGAENADANSGAGVGGEPTPGPDAALALQLAVDWLAGALGGRGEQALAARVVRVVVAGGLLAGAGSDGTAPTTTGKSAVDAWARSAALGALRDADATLCTLCSAVPLDVMPGPGDPANTALPQQPLHPALLAATVGASGSASSAEPKSTPPPALVRATNPHEFEIAGVRFLGCSGQGVADVLRYSETTDPLDVLEAMLRWRHTAPTAPDTLAAYPFHDRDPFLLESAPNVLFVGGQAGFGTRLVRGPDGQIVRLVMVPAFHVCPAMVLVNIDSLACDTLHFGQTLA